MTEREKQLLAENALAQLHQAERCLLYLAYPGAARLTVEYDQRSGLVITRQYEDADCERENPALLTECEAQLLRLLCLDRLDILEVYLSRDKDAGIAEEWRGGVSEIKSLYKRLTGRELLEIGDTRPPC